MTRPCPSPRGAASRALKPLNTLALGLLCLPASAPSRFASVGAPSGTELTSTDGLMTISPEGGP